MIRYIVSLLLVFFLAACAGENTDSSFVAAAKDAVVGTCKDALGVIVAPLEDLNLKRQDIPEALENCSLNPYAVPLPPLCMNIDTELTKLDELLGPDMEPAPLPWLTVPKDKKYYVGQGMEQGSHFARQQAVGIVRGKADIIPFRGVVRKVTGAEKHRKAVERAYEAGRLRRAFLKGLRTASGCISTTN